MKRSRSPSPSLGSSLFLPTHSGSDSEKKLKVTLAESKEVIEQEPCIPSGDLYIIRRIKLGDEPGSLLMELDRNLDKNETGVLDAALRHLNDMREKAPLGRRLSRLSISLEYSPEDSYLIKVTASKKEDMPPFINYLEKLHHISKKTAEDICDLFEQSHEQRSSVHILRSLRHLPIKE